MAGISILVEVELFLLSGESETRIVEVTVAGPNEFISKLLSEVHKEFTDNIRLPVGHFQHRIYILNEKEKLIRITTAASVEPLFKWNGIYFDNAMIQHKFRVQIFESNQSSKAPNRTPARAAERTHSILSQPGSSRSDSVTKPKKVHFPDPPTEAWTPSPPVVNLTNLSNPMQIKDVPALAKMFTERHIKVTNQTAALISNATEYDVTKIKQVMEYVDLSDNEMNKDFTRPDIVQRVLQLLVSHDWIVEKLLDEEDDEMD